MKEVFLWIGLRNKNKQQQRKIQIYQLLLPHGSGKTAVLVERIIHKIIDDKIGIDKILVVTFTNAAAAEMRERI